MTDMLDRRLAEIILDLVDELDADLVTDNGRITIDPTHGQSGRQSSIGSHFRTWKQQGLIVQTGRIRRSQSPHRKGGMIQVWKPTDYGLRWARHLLRDTCFVCCGEIVAEDDWPHTYHAAGCGRRNVDFAGPCANLTGCGEDVHATCCPSCT